MPLEDEELKLTVTLVDNATAGLRQLSQTMQQAGRNTKDFNESQNKQHKEGNEQIKSMLELLERGGKAVLPEFARGITGIGTSITGMAAGVVGATAGIIALTKAITESVKAFDEYIAKQVQLSQVQQRTGVSPAQQQAIERAYSEQGVPGGAKTAQADIAALTKDLADLLEVNSKLRRAITQGPIPQDVAQQNLLVLQRMQNVKSQVELINLGEQMTKNVEEGRKRELERMGVDTTTPAAIASIKRRGEQWNEILKTQGFMYLTRPVPEQSKAEEEAAQKRADNARAIAEETAKIKDNWDRISEIIWSGAITHSPFYQFLDKLNSVLELFLKAFEPKETPKAETRAQPTWQQQFWQGFTNQLPNMPGGLGVPFALWNTIPGTTTPVAPGTSEADIAGHSLLRGKAAAASRPPPAAPTPPEPPLVQPGAQSPWLYWGGYPPPRLPGHQHGGVVPETGLAMLHKGEVIHNPMERGGALDEQTMALEGLTKQLSTGSWDSVNTQKAVKDLTDEMKKLNMFLARTVVTRMGGLPQGKGIGTSVIGGAAGGDSGLGILGDLVSGGGSLSAGDASNLLGALGGGGGGLGGMLGGLLGGGGGGLGGMLGGLLGGGAGGGRGLASLGGGGGLGGFMQRILGGAGGGMGNILGGRGIPGLGGARPSLGPTPAAPSSKGGGGPPSGPAASALQSKLEGMIKGTGLEGYVPPDGARYGIKTGSAAEWAGLMTGIAGKESGFNPAAHGDLGHFGGAGSLGLFQLSPQDAITYGLQKTPFTREQLMDPDVNARAAVAIMSARAHAGGIGGPRGAAQYWAGPHGYLARGQVSAAPASAAGGGGGGSGEPGAPGAEPVANYFRKIGYAPITSASDPRLTEVSLGSQKWKVNKESAPYFQGFLSDLQAAGAPHLTSSGGWNYRTIRGGRSLSEHAYGGAIDVAETGFGGTIDKPTRDIPPEFAKWVQTHREEYQALERKWHIYGGERFGDLGHYEYGGGGTLGEHVAAADRSAINQRMTHQVEGTGTIHVHVDAPRGTRVAAAGGGLFNKTTVNRRSSMEPAAVSTTRVPTPAPAYQE